jgi:hypothetical protein
LGGSGGHFDELSSRVAVSLLDLRSCPCWRDEAFRAARHHTCVSLHKLALYPVVLLDQSDQDVFLDRNLGLSLADVVGSVFLNRRNHLLVFHTGSILQPPECFQQLSALGGESLELARWKRGLFL